MESYLRDRSQYVITNGQKSSCYSVPSGVPQGSHLGPLLFNLFINDLPPLFNYCNCLLYADDMKLFCKVRNFTDCINLQHDIDSLSEWCSANKLYLNVSKCKFMSFTKKTSSIKFNYAIDNVELNEVFQILDLGVNFDTDLNFNRHIEIKIAKARSMLGFIKRVCRDFHDIYFAHVRSHLEYVSVVWNPVTSLFINKIEAVQKQFLIYVLRFSFRRNANFELPPYSFRCSLIGIQSLELRRNNALAYFVFDVLRNYIDAPNLLCLLNFNVPCHNFRFFNFFKIKYHRTQYGRNGPVSQMCIQFNNIAHLFDFTCSRFEFRSLLNQRQIDVELSLS